MHQRFFIILAAMVAASAPALAASMFSAPGGANDLGNMWLEHVFNGGAFTVSVPDVDGAGHSTLGGTTTTFSGTMPLLFQRIAAMYSSAMLVLAVLIVVYHLFSMVVHTAHEGQALGKSAHQVWAPLRFVFALGLLIPVANGFSSGQWLVMWIAKQGSGLASYIWSGPGVGVGLDYMTSQSKTVVRPDTSPEKMVRELFAIGFCAKKTQMDWASDVAYWRGNADAPTYSPALNATPAEAQDVMNALVMAPSPGADPLSHPGAGAVQAFGKQIVIAGNNVDNTPGRYSQNYFAVSAPAGGVGAYESWWEAKPCGSVVLPAAGADISVASSPEAAAVAALHRAHITGFHYIEQAALQLGASMAAATIRREGDVGITIPIYTGAGYAAIPLSTAGGVKAAQESLLLAYRDAYAASLAGSGLTFCDPGAARGAGAPCSGVPNDHVAYMPIVTAGALSAYAGNPGLGGGSDLGWISAGAYFINLSTKGAALSEAAQIQPVVAAARGCDGMGICLDGTMDQMTVQTEHEGERTSQADGWTGCNAGTITCGVKWAAGKVFTLVGLSNDQGEPIWHTQFTSEHPLSDMMNLGSKLIDAATTLVVAGAGAGAVGTVSSYLGGNGIGWASVLGKVIGELGMLGMALMFLLATAIFLPGVVLFYVLPLLGFYNFLTGVLTWFISLLQAVAAIPIIAIAHLTPHGEGLPSNSARQAYVMLLQIFLRPVMMIFGLIVAILVMNTGIGLLNTLFFGVYKYQIVGGTQGLISSIIYFVLYAAAAFAIANIAIKAIDEFPMRAVSWIGGSSVDTNHDVNTLAALAVANHAQQLGQRGVDTIGTTQGRAAAVLDRRWHALDQQRRDREASKGGGTIENAGKPAQIVTSQAAHVQKDAERPTAPATMERPPGAAEPEKAATPPEQENTGHMPKPEPA